MDFNKHQKTAVDRGTICPCPVLMCVLYCYANIRWYSFPGVVQGADGLPNFMVDKRAKAWNSVDRLAVDELTNHFLHSRTLCAVDYYPTHAYGSHQSFV